MRKSELGNLVAANMIGIMESEEHRSLFRKQAEDECECGPGCTDCKCTAKDCKCKKKDDSDADDTKAKCKCQEDCKCKKDGKCQDDCPCEKKAKKDKEDDSDANDAGCKCDPDCICHKFAKGNKCKGDCKCSKKAKEKEEKEDDDDANDKCECSDACPCKSGGDCNECAKVAKFNVLFNNVLKISEMLDDFGFTKSASNMIRVADALLLEAAGADTIEEMLRENPDLDVDLAVVKESPKEERGEELFDPRMMGAELAEEVDKDDIIAQLEAIERAGPAESLIDVGPGLKEPEFLKEEPALEAPEVGPGLADLPELEDLEVANAEVDAWLKKYASKNDEIELGADLSNLLITAEKEVEDYLIKRNLSFEDED